MRASRGRLFDRARCAHRTHGGAVALKLPADSGRPAREALRREIGTLRRATRSQLHGVVRLIEHGLDGDEFALPSSIDGLLRLRIQQLPESARVALRACSVLDREFTTAAFRALAGLNADPSDILEELVARDVLLASAPDRYRLTHDKLREALERTLGEDERKAQHARAARQLEASSEQLSPEALAAAGYHWAHAGEPLCALRHLPLAAATMAGEGHTLARATALYRLAIRQCELPAETSRARQRELREALADVLVLQARHAEARECLRVLRDELDPADARGLARTFRKVATTHWTLHDYPAAAAALDRADAELARLPEPACAPAVTELIQVRLGRFEQLYFAGKTGPDLDRVALELRPLIELHGAPEQACVYYSTAASYSMLQRRYALDEQAVALARRGVEVARGLAAQQVAFAHFILAFAL